MTVQAFVIDTATGETRARLNVASLAALTGYPLNAGQSLVVYTDAGDIEGFETELVEGEITFTARTYDPATALAVAKIGIRQRIKEGRNQAEGGGCATAYGRIDTTADSQLKIGGASTAALALGASYTIDWRMADNSMVTLDVAKMLEVGLAVAAHVNACQSRKNVLDLLVDEATTLAELAAIDIETGWPG